MNPDIVEIQEYLVLDSIDDLEYPPLCLLTTYIKYWKYESGIIPPFITKESSCI